MEARKKSLTGCLLGAGSLLFALCTPAVADMTLKKQVIDDCPSALQTAEKLRQAEKEALIPYLIQVLHLNTLKVDDSAAPPPRIPPGESSLNEPWAVDFWRSLQPARELKAKECSLRILRLFAQFSLPAVMDIIALQRDPVISSELRELVSSTTLAIVQQTPDDYPLPEDLLDKLLEHVEKDGSYLAEAVLLEFDERTIPTLLELFKTPEKKKRELASRLLLDIDASGERIGPALVDLLLSGDDDLRRRSALVLGKLAVFLPSAIPALVRRLDDVSLEVQSTALHSLNKVADSKLLLHQESVALILKALKRSSEPQRALLEQLLHASIRSSSAGADQLVAAFSSADADTQISILRITAELKQEDVFRLMLGALKNSSLQVRLQGVRSLSMQSSRTSEVIDAYAKLLQANAKNKDSDEKQKVLLSVISAAAKLNPGRLGERLKPYLLQALALRAIDGQEETLAVQSLLASLGSSVVPALTKQLASSDPLIRRRAAAALSAIKPVEKKVLLQLSQLLKDSNVRVREEAKKGLISIGPPAAAEVVKLLKSGSFPAQLAAAEVLRAVSPQDLSSLSVLLEGVKREPCSEKVRLAKIIAPIASGDSPLLADYLLRCLSEESVNSLAVIDSLLAVSPLPEAGQAVLFELIDKNALDKKLQLSLLDKRAQFGLPPERVVGLLAGILQTEEDALKSRALVQLADLGPAARIAIPQLRALAQNENTEPLLHHEAAVTLTKIDQQSFDYTGFFLAELSNDHAYWAQRSLQKLDPLIAVPLLQTALAELPSKKLIYAVKAIGAFGSDAKSAAGALFNLLITPDAALRTEVLRALLKIDPDNPRTFTALQSEMSSENAVRLHSEDFSGTAAALLDRVISAPQSRIQLRAAHALVNGLGAQRDSET